MRSARFPSGCSTGWRESAPPARATSGSQSPRNRHRRAPTPTSGPSTGSAPRTARSAGRFRSAGNAKAARSLLKLPSHPTRRRWSPCPRGTRRRWPKGERPSRLSHSRTARRRPRWGLGPTASGARFSAPAQGRTYFARFCRYLPILHPLQFSPLFLTTSRLSALHRLACFCGLSLRQKGKKRAMFLLSVFSGSLRIVPTSAKTITHLDHEGMPRKVTAVSPTRGEQAEAGGLRGLCLSSRGAQQLHQANVNLDTEIRLPAHLLFLGGESAA